MKNQYLNQQSVNQMPYDDEDGASIGSKKSFLTVTLLSNYVLGINLLKNIAMKFSDEDNFNDEFDTMMG